MKIICICILHLFFCEKANSQTTYYEVVYNTTIDKKILVDSNSIKVRDKHNLVAKEVANEMMEMFSRKHVVVQVSDSIIAFKDSTLIYRYANYPQFLDQRFPIILTGSVTLMKRNRFFTLNDNVQIEKNLSSPIVIMGTSTIEYILNYKCRIYTDSSYGYKLWICDELPSYINPGVNVFNTNGGILKYELFNKETKESITSSVRFIRLK